MAEQVFAGQAELKPSENDYDWLDSGIYFWEQNPTRAFEFATEVHVRRPDQIATPAVVGAMIDLGRCLNLLDTYYLGLVVQAYEQLAKIAREAGQALPRNELGPDRLLRRLDRAVVRRLHDARAIEGEPAFDTARAAFLEGGPLYPEAGFLAKNHIQICVRNPRCIKGYFRVLGADSSP